MGDGIWEMGYLIDFSHMFAMFSASKIRSGL